MASLAHRLSNLPIPIFASGLRFRDADAGACDQMNVQAACPDRPLLETAMKAIVFDAIGSPRDVLYLHDVPMPRIGDGEVLVRMVSASVNPGDFLFIQNLYPEPKKPLLPRQIAGNHGAGI